MDGCPIIVAHKSTYQLLEERIEQVLGDLGRAELQHAVRASKVRLAL